MEYIQIKTKREFRRIVKNTKHKLYMWDLFRENTCYVPEEDCFISVSKARELGFKIVE